MGNTYTPPEQEILFLLNQVINWQELFELPGYRHADSELGAAIISEACRFSAEVLSPLNQAGDAEGCHLTNGNVQVPDEFRKAYGLFTEGGWPGLDLPLRFGGQALPITLTTAVSEMMNGACVAFSMMPCMLRAAAALLAEHADNELKERIVPAIVAGGYGATIVITEPQAGSDVGAIKTYAIKQNDGSYKLTGTKIFITCGDQNYTEQIIHLVLARVKGADPGTRGLSLFLVPKRSFDKPEDINHVSVSRLEKKMGLKASPTCVLNFDQALGYRIGKEGKGLNCLFSMMNLMRLEVATQSVGIASAASQSAASYARERKQGGQTEASIMQHADVRRMLATMQAYTEAMRALVLETSFNLDKSRHAEKEQERAECRALAEFLLPVCKAWCSDRAFEMTNLGIQVMGGHGYIADEGMEQYVRDCRVLSIYEGTNGIQALDLVMRKLLLKQGTGYTLFVKRIEVDLAKHANHPKLERLAKPLADGLNRLKSCTDLLVNIKVDSLRDAEAAATPYLQLVGQLAGAWMLFRIAAAAENGASQLEKYTHAQFYMEYLLPESQVYEQRIRSGAKAIDKCF